MFVIVRLLALRVLSQDLVVETKPSLLLSKLTGIN